MFPNLRLMIVAVLASIMGIGCALGLFAEFRVSRNSFVRESNADAPLQLGSNDLAPAALVNGPATFGFRFQANALSFASDRADGMVPSIGDASVEANSAPAAELTTPAVPAINTAEPSPTPDRGSTTTPANPAGNVTPAETGTVGNRDIQQDTRESAPANIAVTYAGGLRSTRRNRAKVRNRASKPKRARTEIVRAPIACGGQRERENAGGAATADHGAPLPETTTRRAQPAEFRRRSPVLSMDLARGIANAATGVAARHRQARPPGQKDRRRGHGFPNDGQYELSDRRPRRAADL